jgi:hypothetical protein
VAALTTVLSLASTAAGAQTHAELRGGLSIGSHTATAAALETVPAFSYQALVVHRVSPRLSALGGYVRTAFGCAEGFCTGRDLTVTGGHALAGAEWGSGGPWFRVGLLFGATSVGTEGESADPGLGLMGGAGLAVGRGRVRLLPGVSYRWLIANTPSRDDHAVALTVDVGVSISFGAAEG